MNLNLWLTPDEANLGAADGPHHGGLRVYKTMPPEDWKFMVSSVLLLYLLARL